MELAALVSVRHEYWSIPDMDCHGNDLNYNAEVDDADHCKARCNRFVNIRSQPKVLNNKYQQTQSHKDVCFVG